MDYSKYRDYGKPVKETYREAVARISKQVVSGVEEEYKGREKGDRNAYDCLENIIKEIIVHEDEFICTRDNITSRIIAVHDIDGNHVASLLIGPYPIYRRTVLEKLAESMSHIIYRTGMKNEVTEIMLSSLLREIKKRFGMKNSGYIFIGIEGNREEGIIKKDDDV